MSGGATWVDRIWTSRRASRDVMCHVRASRLFLEVTSGATCTLGRTGWGLLVLGGSHLVRGRDERGGAGRAGSPGLGGASCRARRGGSCFFFFWLQLE